MVATLLEVYGSVLTGREAWYVSTPITTGRRLHELRIRNGIPGPEDYQTFIEEQVIEPNRREAQELVGRLRRDRARIVIDPTSVGDVPGWEQDDYRYFWGRVIKEFARCVVFADGWEHSSGCSYEFLVAVQAGIETVNHRLELLTREKGILLLEQAVATALGREANADFLQAVLDFLVRRGDLSVT